MSGSEPLRHGPRARHARDRRRPRGPRGARRAREGGAGRPSSRRAPCSTGTSSSRSRARWSRSSWRSSSASRRRGARARRRGAAAARRAAHPARAARRDACASPARATRSGSSRPSRRRPCSRAVDAALKGALVELVRAARGRGPRRPRARDAVGQPARRGGGPRLASAAFARGRRRGLHHGADRQRRPRGGARALVRHALLQGVARMKLGRVIGTLVATVKAQGMERAEAADRAAAHRGPRGRGRSLRRDRRVGPGRPGRSRDLRGLARGGAPARSVVRAGRSRHRGHRRPARLRRRLRREGGLDDPRARLRDGGEHRRAPVLRREEAAHRAGGARRTARSTGTAT